VWSIETFQLVKSIQAHQGSVLCLYLSADESVLFSSAGDAIVNVGRSGQVFSPGVGVRFGALTVFQVWNAKTFENLYNIYSTFDVGDVFCVVYSSALQTAYFGAQNTSIQVTAPPLPGSGRVSGN